MTTLITIISTSLLLYACGIFTVLSLVEKPVWPLMANANNKTVSDDTARLIHAALKRVIHLLPPTMITTMSSTLVLLVLNIWLTDFSMKTIIVFGVFIALMTPVVLMLKKRIAAVDSVRSEGDIASVRSGLGKLAALHHMGLFAAACTALTQVTLAAGAYV